MSFQNAAGHQLPFPADAFDVVISNGVINLIPDTEGALAEIHRVVKHVSSVGLLEGAGGEGGLGRVRDGTPAGHFSEPGEGISVHQVNRTPGGGLTNNIHTRVLHGRCQSGHSVITKLKATSAVTAIASTRIYPQLNTQEPTFPLIIVTVIGGEGQARLSGASNSLRRFTVRVDCYAETEISGGALGKVVREALCPDGTPWTDSTNGVQGCLYVDTAADVPDDGVRYQSEKFDVWHKPT